MTPQEVKQLAAWAAQECAWQLTGPLEVGYFIVAYFTLAAAHEITEELILRLGNIIEPAKNPSDHYRQVAVFVGYSEKAPWQEVPRLMAQLVRAVADLGPTEWFREFEEIHPFRDGNGRTGALIYNMLNGTYSPLGLEFPPNLWNDPRRADKEKP